MFPTFIVARAAEAGLAVRLQVTRDVSSTEHFAADVAGHLAFVPDHVRAQTVFGSEGRRAGLEHKTTERCFSLNTWTTCA